MVPSHNISNPNTVATRLQEWLSKHHARVSNTGHPPHAASQRITPHDILQTDTLVTYTTLTNKNRIENGFKYKTISGLLHALPNHLISMIYLSKNLKGKAPK